MSHHHNLSSPNRHLNPCNSIGAHVVPCNFWEPHHRDNINSMQSTKGMLQRVQLTDYELQKIVNRFPYGQIVKGDGNCFYRCCMYLIIWTLAWEYYDNDNNKKIALSPLIIAAMEFA